MAKRFHVRNFCVALCFILLIIYPFLSLDIHQLSETWKYDSEIEGIVTNRPWQRVILSNFTAEKENGEYPKEIFTFEQNRQGAFILYILGICYMFLALSVICDEFFVPSLHVITEILDISDDVAGATFMAAGGSAPELFTSILGVFVARSHIGFGTIVGSAVFNVLFVIGMCVIFSKSVLHLTWWPLLRDSIFYSCALGLLIAFFSDSQIKWWESSLLFGVYIIYVTFMYFNEKIERNVKSFLASFTKKNPKVGMHNDVGPLYRNGALQLVIHTLDPVSEATAENKFHQIKAILEVEIKTQYIDPKEANVVVKEKYRFEHDKKRLDEENGELNGDLRKHAMVNNYLADGKDPNSKHSFENNDSTTFSRPSSNTISQYTYTNYASMPSSAARPSSECSVLGGMNQSIQDDENSFSKRERGVSVNSSASHNWNATPGETQKVERTVRFSGRMSKMSCSSHHGMSRMCLREAAAERQNSIVCDDDEPLSLAMPKGKLAKLWYIIKFPIVIVLFCTLPDVRKPTQRKFFAWSFLGSIIWIGGFSYLMVWWASVTGDVLKIPPEVMGLTFLAAGTSIPDLITSVLVAREGLGDMAVSSSIGSNLFDVTVGLPIPWFIWSAINSFTPKPVLSSGLFCSTFLLFFMLLSVIASIAISNWKMTKTLAAAMFLLYVVFLTVSILIELNIFPCFL